MDILTTLRNNKLAQRAAIESLCLLIMICGLYYTTVAGMVDLWLTSETYSHGLFIIPLAVILLVQRLKDQAPINAKPTFMPLILLVGASFVWLIATLAHINLVAQLAVMSFIPCVVWLRYGWAMTWRLKGPLLFLFLAVPVGDFLIPHLQDITATLSIAMIELTGIPVYHDGLYISIPAGNFLVAEACSGIRFLISAITIAVFYALLYLKSTKNRLLMMSLGAVVPIVANGIRVFMIIVIAHLSNMEAATGFDHIVYGWVFFSIVMVLLIVLGNVLADKEHAKDKKVDNSDAGSSDAAAPDIQSTQGQSKSHQQAIWPFYAAIIIAISLAPIAKRLLAYDPSSQTIDATLAYQTKITKGLFSDPDTQWAVSFPSADVVLRQDGINQKDISKYVISYDYETDEKELINYENRLFNPDRWSLKDRRMIPVSVNGETVMTLHLTIVNLAGQKREILMSYLIDGNATAQTLKAKALQVMSKLMARDFGGQAIILSALSDDVDINQLKLEFADVIQQAQRPVRN